MLSRFTSIMRLLRWPNLLVVALTQALVFFQVLLPAYQTARILSVCSTWKLVQLIMITIGISASGYIINDLRDSKIDAINRPGTNPVETLGRDFVQWLYALSIMGGFFLSLLVAFRLNELELLWIYPLTVALLALYSIKLKSTPILGNVLVALYCAGVPGIICLAERSSIYHLLEVRPDLGIHSLRICVLFMLFGFLATLLRELVKDMEDIEGDSQLNCKTLPVLVGLPLSKSISLVLATSVGLALACPFLLGWLSFQLDLPSVYAAFLLILLIFMGWQLSVASTAKHFHRVSQELKLFLLLGLGLLICFN